MTTDRMDVGDVFAMVAYDSDPRHYMPGALAMDLRDLELLGVMGDQFAAPPAEWLDEFGSMTTAEALAMAAAAARRLGHGPQAERIARNKAAALAAMAGGN